DRRRSGRRFDLRELVRARLRLGGLRRGLFDDRRLLGFGRLHGRRRRRWALAFGERRALDRNRRRRRLVLVEEEPVAARASADRDEQERQHAVERAVARRSGGWRGHGAGARIAVGGSFAAALDQRGRRAGAVHLVLDLQDLGRALLRD